MIARTCDTTQAFTDRQAPQTVHRTFAPPMGTCRSNVLISSCRRSTEDNRGRNRPDQVPFPPLVEMGREPMGLVAEWFMPDSAQLFPSGITGAIPVVRSESNRAAVLAVTYDWTAVVGVGKLYYRR